MSTQDRSNDHTPVSFRSLESSYPTDGQIYVTIIKEFGAFDANDYIALHSIGFSLDQDPIYKLPYDQFKFEADGKQVEAVIPISLFATKLPDDQFYQLCYYSSNQLTSASNSFQICRARAEDLLEVPSKDEQEEDEFVVIKSDKALLQERINVLARTNQELTVENQALINQNRKLLEELNDLKLVKRKQDSIILKLQEDNVTLSDEIASGKAQVIDFQESLNSANMSLERYRHLSQEKVDEFNEISKCKDLLQQEYQNCVKLIQSINNEKDQLASKLQQTRNNFDAQASLLQDGQRIQVAMKEEIKGLTLKIKDLEDELNISRAQIESLRNEVIKRSKLVERKEEELTNQVTSLKSQLQIATTEKDQFKDSLKKSNEEKVKAEARLEKLKSKVTVSIFRNQVSHPSHRANCLQDYFEKRRQAKAAASTAAGGSNGSCDGQTVPKSVLARQASDLEHEVASDDDVEPELITIPCGQCKEDIICTADLRQMANHLESKHNQRLCPFCSMTFDATLGDTERELHLHVEKHLEAL